MILRIVAAEVAGPYLLRLAFSDATRKTVDVGPLLRGPIFEPLRESTYFSQVKLDQVCGTVTWPNGADLAPEALHELAAVEAPMAASTPEDGGSSRRP